MSDKVLIGSDVVSLDTSPEFSPYSKVVIVTGAQDADGNDIVYSAGNNTGRTLTINNPFGSQIQADRILASLLATGFKYQPYKASSAMFNPQAEMGDGVTVADTYSGIYKMSRSFGPLMEANIEAPEDEEVDHEYPYEKKQDRVYKRELGEARTQITANANAISIEAARAREKEGQLETAINVNASAIILSASQTLSAVNANVKSDNLIYYPYHDVSPKTPKDSGITFTANSDGSIKINGTAAKTAYYFLTRKSDHTARDSTDQLKLSAGKYTLSMRGGTAGVVVGIEHGVNGESATNIYRLSNSDRTHTFEYASANASHIVDVYIRIDAGVAISNQTVKIQLEYGDTAHTWQSPTVGTNSIQGSTVRNSSQLTIQATQISAKVESSKQGGTNSFGWSLTDSAHTWTANNSTVLKITKDGLTVYGSGEFTGKITAKSGYIGNGTNGFTITNSAIYNGMTSLSDTTNNGVYIGTNGIALGKGNFKVTSSGAVTAKNLSITGGSISLKDSNGNTAFSVTSTGSVSANNMKLTGTLNVGGQNITAENLRLGASRANGGYSTWNGTTTSWNNATTLKGETPSYFHATSVDFNTCGVAKTLTYKGYTVSVAYIQDANSGNFYYVLYLNGYRP